MVSAWTNFLACERKDGATLVSDFEGGVKRNKMGLARATQTQVGSTTISPETLISGLKPSGYRIPH